MFPSSAPVALFHDCQLTSPSNEADTGGRRNIATKWMRPGPRIWKSGKFGIEKKSKKIKLSKSKSVSPKMLARSGLVGKNSSRPHLGPSLAIFCVGRKNRKNVEISLIFLGGPMGPIHPVWGNGCNISSAIRTMDHGKVLCQLAGWRNLRHFPAQN